MQGCRERGNVRCSAEGRPRHSGCRGESGSGLRDDVGVALGRGVGAGGVLLCLPPSTRLHAEAPDELGWGSSRGVGHLRGLRMPRQGGPGDRSPHPSGVGLLRLLGAGAHQAEAADGEHMGSLSCGVSGAPCPVGLADFFPDIGDRKTESLQDLAWAPPRGRHSRVPLPAPAPPT